MSTKTLHSLHSQKDVNDTPPAKGKYFIASQAFKKGKPGKITVAWHTAKCCKKCRGKMECRNNGCSCHWDKAATLPAREEKWGEGFRNRWGNIDINDTPFYKTALYEGIVEYIRLARSQAHEEGRREAIRAIRVWTNGRTVTKDSLRSKLNKLTGAQSIVAESQRGGKKYGKL